MNAMAFRELTADVAVLTELLAGSGVTMDVTHAAEAFTGWADSRQFIATAITGDGSILDYGCANGFLLRSLQEWCPHALRPYGVDIDSSRLDEARAIFTASASHFGSPDDVKSFGVIDGFDFVYWAVGDNLDFNDPQNVRWLRSVADLTALGGRFIIGFYETHAQNLRKLNDIERSGIRFSGTMFNTRGGELIAWIDDPRTLLAPYQGPP